MVTTAVPNRRIDLGATALALTPSSGLGIAPMNLADAGTALRLTLVGPEGDQTAAFGHELHHGPAFPNGVWGLPQPSDDRKIPAGDVIEAIDGVRLLHGGRHPGRAAPDRLSPHRDRRPAAAALRQRGRQPHGLHRSGQGPGHSCCRPTPATRACSPPARSGWPARVRAPRRWRRCTASATRRRGSARSPTAWRPRRRATPRSTLPDDPPAGRGRHGRGHARGHRRPDLDRGRSRSVRRAHHGQGRPRRARRRRPDARRRAGCAGPARARAAASRRRRRGRGAGRHGRGLGPRAAEPPGHRRDRCGRRPRRGRRRARSADGHDHRAGRTARRRRREHDGGRGRDRRAARCPTPSATSATPSARSCWSAVRHARVVALAHGGAVLADATTDPAADPATVALVQGTERLAVAVAGVDAPSAAGPARLARGHRARLPGLGHRARRGRDRPRRGHRRALQSPAAHAPAGCAAPSSSPGRRS